MERCLLGLVKVCGEMPIGVSLWRDAHLLGLVKVCGEMPIGLVKVCGEMLMYWG